MYSNFQGGVAYNNIPQGNLNMTSLRSNIGDILDQEELFAGTVRENLCMGKSSVSFEDVRWAAESVGVDDFIRKLPSGYQTDVISEGKGFSRNAIRKIIIARAVASKPKLLVLEEFLHNLERKDREQITSFLCAKQHDWTVIAASNDPVFAKQCDRIVVMEEGTVIETGTYEEIAKKPYFENLFMSV